MSKCGRRNGGWLEGLEYITRGFPDCSQRSILMSPECFYLFIFEEVQENIPT